MNRVSEHVQEANWLIRLLLFAWVIRLTVVIVFNLTGAISKLGLSSDSFYYDREGRMIAQYLNGGGSITSLDWIDHGWFEFTGLVYHLLSPNSFWMQLINITLSTLAVYFSYKFALRAFSSFNVARLTAVMVAFFPSFIYWSTMMLKDPAALMAMTMITCSLVCLRQKFELRWLLALAAGMLIYLGIREYMFLVCLLVIPVAIIPFAQRRPGTMIISSVLVLIVLGFITKLLGYGFLGLDEIGRSHYFDLEYINATRVNIGDHGSGAIFSNPGEALWGVDWVTDFTNVLIAIFYFFVSLDLTNIRSLRQLIALPEVIIFISIIPSLFRGGWATWKRYRRTAWPILLMAMVVLAVYSSATTNLGALFRWRMQSMPMFMAITALGVVLHQKSWVWRIGRKMRVIR